MNFFSPSRPFGFHFSLEELVSLVNWHCLTLLFQVESPVEFGDSWKVDALECPSTPDVPNPCDSDRHKYKQADDLCYILVDRTGMSRLFIKLHLGAVT